MSAMKRAARLTAWAGLTGAGMLHAVWASGSSWPAKNAKRLGEAVAGSARAMPDERTTWIVAGAAFSGAAIAAGGLGEGRAAVALRRTMGVGLLARALLGGDAALAALGLPPAGKKFQELDRRYYRRFFGVLGAALILGAKK